MVLYIILGSLDKQNGKPAVREEDRPAFELYDRALSDLNKTAVDDELAPGYLKVLPRGNIVSERDLLRRLGVKNNVSSMFTYTLAGVNEATATAMGVDRQHHVVNAYLEGYSPFKTENLWTPLYVLSKRKEYQYDHLNYAGDQEVWQTSRQAFYYTRGDCEDHAIALADWLIDMGEDARVVLGTYKGGGHAWVVLFKDGKEFILEATQKSRLRGLNQYPLASLKPDYRPSHMFNRDGFWFNSGSTYTTRYRSKHWVKKSLYNRS